MAKGPRKIRLSTLRNAGGRPREIDTLKQYREFCRLEDGIEKTRYTRPSGIDWSIMETPEKRWLYDDIDEVA